MPDQHPSPAPRLETVSAGGRPVARLALLPMDAFDPDALVGRLEESQRRRAAGFASRTRFTEYVGSRWLLSGLDHEGEPALGGGPRSISHCRRWIAVGGAAGGRLGLDVESRRPRALRAVAERLGWHSLPEDRYLQAWTLWEAWRKLEGGSVLDAPDRTYADVLEEVAGLLEAPREVAGVTWWSLDLDGAVLSVAVRP